MNQAPSGRIWSLLAIALWVPTALVLLWMSRSHKDPLDDPHPGDIREAVRMSPEERDHVLRRMRANLVSMHRILEATARDDMPAVARLAGAEGSAPFITQEMPSLRGVIPPPWTQLGKLVHAEMGELAKAAERDLPRSELLARLAKVSAGCVSCHNTYRIAPDDEDRRPTHAWRYP